jgi:hypothetical protein
MEIIELIINEENGDGVFAISLVDKPAIEQDFMHFNNQAPLKFAEIDEDQRLIAGPILVPNKLIYREKQNGEPFHVFFKPSTIKQASELYLQEGRQGSATAHHLSPIKGVTMVQSWIVNNSEIDTYKSYQPEVELPKGSWYGVFKVENDEVWQSVKAGEFKGFSIEILSTQINLEKMGVFTDLLKKFEETPEGDNFAVAITTDGQTLSSDAEDFNVGEPIYIEVDGEKMAAPVGTYETEDATIIVVEEEGILASITPAEDVDESLITEKEFSEYKKSQEVILEGLAKILEGMNSEAEAMTAQNTELKSVNDSLRTANESYEAELSSHSSAIEELKAPVVEEIKPSADGQSNKEKIVFDMSTARGRSEAILARYSK